MDDRPRELDLGLWVGRVRLAEDFDELPDDVLDDFEGRGHDEPLA